MNYKNLFLIIPAVFISFSSFAQSKVSLQDAIRFALKNNPRTQANALRLQAAFEHLQAYKQSVYLPKASVSYSQDLQNQSSKSARASINMNLFNGFSDYYRIQAQECNYKLTEASYKSTNTMMQNTSGQIVGMVASHYVSLVDVRQKQSYDQNTLQKLNLILPVAKDEEQRTIIENYLNSTQISIQESVSELQIAEADYKYIVNSDAPTQTDTLSEVMTTIEIPQNANQAFDISLVKSPEILSAKLSLECNQLSRKAERASLYSARIDISASKNTDFNGPSTGSTSANLNVTIPFDLGRINSYKADEKNMTARQLDLDDTIAEIKNNLNNNYLRLKSSLETAAAYEDSYNKNEIKIRNYLAKVNSLAHDEINILINLMRTQDGQFFMLNMNKRQVINLKYGIQRNIGTLFETNRIYFQE